MNLIRVVAFSGLAVAAVLVLGGHPAASRICTTANVSMAYEQAHATVPIRGASMVTGALQANQLEPCSGSPDAWSDAILSLAGEEHWGADGYLPISDMIQIGLDRQSTLPPRFFYTLDNTGGDAIYPAIAAQFGHSYRFTIAWAAGRWQLGIADVATGPIWSTSVAAHWDAGRVAWWDFETSQGSALDALGPAAAMRISATNVRVGSEWAAATVEPCRIAYAVASCGLDGQGFFAYQP